LNKILETSDSEAGLKTEKSGGATGGEGECKEVGEELSDSERRSLDKTNRLSSILHYETYFCVS